MRVILNCTGGGSHSLMLLEHTTVLDLKQHVAKKEGVPVDQQLLLFAGRQLFPDSALLLEHLGLDTYSLAHEVVVYMQRQLADPVRVHLCQPGSGPCQLQPELVESSSSLTNIMDLLKQRHLACRPFPIAAATNTVTNTVTNNATSNSAVGNSAGSAGSSGSGASSSSSSGSAILPSCVVVKRQDGSCCSRVHVTESCNLHQLIATIEQVEGVAPSYLSFYQAPDGCLHVVAGPSADPCTSSHTVYGRSSMPQTAMMVKDPGSTACVPYSTLVKEQAVMP